MNAETEWLFAEKPLVSWVCYDAHVRRQLHDRVKPDPEWLSRWSQSIYRHWKGGYSVDDCVQTLVEAWLIVLSTGGWKRPRVSLIRPSCVLNARRAK